MIQPYTEKILNSIKKARGQMDLIAKMIQEDRYCVDIIQQSNAAIGLLRSANNFMMESHLQTCGHKLNSSKKVDKEKFIREIIRAFTVSNRKF